VNVRLRLISFFAPLRETGDLMDREIKKIEFKDEFKVCPECGYKDGFHSIFKKEGGTTHWLFICPSCHSVFDIGFTV
jgi:transposase-like protein